MKEIEDLKKHFNPEPKAIPDKHTVTLDSNQGYLVSLIEWELKKKVNIKKIEAKDTVKYKLTIKRKCDEA